MSFVRVLPLVALAGLLAVPVNALADVTASPAPAASDAPPSTSHHHRHRRQSFLHAVQALGLTNAQQQQVASFHAQEQQANKNADTPTRQANAAKMRQQILGILTPDQKSQLAAQLMHRGHGSTDANPSVAPAAPNPAPSP